MKIYKFLSSKLNSDQRVNVKWVTAENVYLYINIQHWEVSRNMSEKLSCWNEYESINQNK